MDSVLRNAAQMLELKIYENSIQTHNSTTIAMVKGKKEKALLAAGRGPLYVALEGAVHYDTKLAPLTHANRLVLNQFFAYTVPRAFGPEVATIGLGDRLGLAGVGHLKTVKGKQIYPVLAQQSIRELNLTGRTYEEVLDAACFAVFQENYRDGFGADGDHLKVEADIEMAINLGFTMLTLDCSEYIDNEIDSLDREQRQRRYDALPADVRNRYEQAYAGRTFQVGDESIFLSRDTLIDYVLIYGAAIDFMEYIHTKYMKTASRDIDFEISIDETLTPTDPAAHFLVSHQLYERGVSIFSMAPRFCGEFQKGIDYIGDIDQFEKELKVHALIADHFGYKLSIHSGSDKFSVFALIGQYTGGRFHVKTAGTNWLEAVRTVARAHPDLYRRMHAFALEHVDEALAYYQVSMQLEAIVPLDDMDDASLPTYMDEDHARQLIHITYGLLLQAKDEQGHALFKDEFYQTLHEQEASYEQALLHHIGRHLTLLGK